MFLDICDPEAFDSPKSCELLQLKIKITYNEKNVESVDIFIVGISTHSLFSFRFLVISNLSFRAEQDSELVIH